MIYLFIVSLVWAFSFGLIKGNLAGIDSTFVAFCRMLISVLVFLPFIRLHGVAGKMKIKLALTGLIQFGLMYIFYLAAFKTLQAYEVALFTIFTPILVTLIDDAFARRFNFLHLVVALITVGGTWIIEGQAMQSPGILRGFLLVQVSNLCYAFGQIYYRRLLNHQPELKDKQVFGYLYIGALVVTLLATLFLTDYSNISITSNQLLTLFYLGAVASGLGFFLWNFGARKVNTGTLAVFNDLKIPLAVAVSLLVFGESTNIPRLLIGGAIIVGALVLNELLSRKKIAQADNQDLLISG